MTPCEGFPEDQQTNSYLFFKNEKEGYLFGAREVVENMATRELKDPNFSPQSIEIATIYKTINGGINWKRIYSSVDSYFEYSRAINKGNFIYIDKVNGLSNMYSGKILKFDVNTNTITESKSMKGPKSLLVSSDKIFSLSDKVYELNNKLQLLDSFRVNFPISHSALVNKHFFVVSSGRNVLTRFDSERYFESGTDFELPIFPECLLHTTSDDLLISGTDTHSNKNTMLVKFEVNKNKLKILKKFNGYSVIKGVRSKGKVIAGFVGNIKGIEYDLFYSLDSGKTWKIRILGDLFISETTILVGNTLYMIGYGMLREIRLN